MRLEPEAKNPKEQLNNAAKSSSAQFHEDKKQRFGNTQTCPTCPSPKRKTLETSERFCRDKPVTEGGQLDRGG